MRFMCGHKLHGRQASDNFRTFGDDHRLQLRASRNYRIGSRISPADIFMQRALDAGQYVVRWRYFCLHVCVRSPTVREGPFFNQ